MNTRQVKRYRTQLENLRDRVRAVAWRAADDAHGPAGGQNAGDLSNAPFHLGDEGSDEFLHDMNAALAENEAFLHNEISDALGRLDAGQFGKCEACGESIAAERLEALPYVRFCIKCADENQQGLAVNLNSGRPRLPLDTIAPEGSMEEDWRPEVDAARGAGGRNVMAQDEHAAGEPGGGSAIGGLAGSNSGRGEPEVSDLQDAAGSGDFDFDEARDDPREAPRSGRSGGAVGGTPARKRSS